MRKKSPSKKQCSNKNILFFKRPSLKKGIFKLFYWFLALALLPCVYAALKAFAVMVPSIGAEGINAWWVYLLGIGVYFLFERFLTKPMNVYVFGHELTHAITGILSGAKVHSFKSSSKGGEVRLSRRLGRRAAPAARGAEAPLRDAGLAGAAVSVHSCPARVRASSHGSG